MWGTRVSEASFANYHNMHTSKKVGLVKADKKGGNICIDF